MRTVFGNSLAGATSISGQELRREQRAQEVQQKQPQGTDRNARKVVQLNGARIAFRDLAKFAWPTKTEFYLAELTGADPRTCRRWLADHNEPPADALGVVLCEIMRRFHQRG